MRRLLSVALVLGPLAFGVALGAALPALAATPIDIMNAEHDATAGAQKVLVVGPTGVATTNPLPVLTQTAGASVTCGVASGVLIAAGASTRWVRFENIDAAGDGFHFAIGGAAATTGQLVLAGGVVWRYTAAAINCIRTAGADSTVSVQEITQ